MRNLVVAGCSFSDYLDDNDYVYGDRLAMMLGARYVHEGAGSGSNWRMWRRITNMVLNEKLMPGDIVIVQYTGLERKEFWSDKEPDPKKGSIMVREAYDKNDGSVIRFKAQSYKWHKENEAEFLKMFQEHHVSSEFSEEQFNTQHLMFQCMLKAHNVNTIFLYGRHRQQYPLLEHFKLTMFDEGHEFRKDKSTWYHKKDNSHLCDAGHVELAKKLFRHIKELGWHPRK
ncbi:MAG: hypothetical protein CMA31_02885 [Euryarchaeota archaeon]|nr:hypothetical protein [Euryarchaeota archaeon]|tara:strand:- start:1740 stop:2423 length:684 start_codon:yes stop_codon:yes gene_type:complete